MVAITQNPHYAPRITFENIYRIEKILNRRINRNFNTALCQLLDIIENKKSEVVK
jgi:hypothetical protein